VKEAGNTGAFFLTRLYGFFAEFRGLPLVGPEPAAHLLSALSS
jgi:hypothetical protein